ncbi:hypothetical protein S83_027374, partial [Arachis hypogaea]
YLDLTSINLQKETNWLQTLCNSKVVPCDEKDKNSLLKLKHGVTDHSGVLSSWSIGKKKIVANEEEFIATILMEKSRSSLQFLSSLELGNNDFSIIHYHGQGENSSNNLHHLDFIWTSPALIFKRKLISFSQLHCFLLFQSYIWSIADFGTSIHPCNMPILLHLTSLIFLALTLYHLSYQNGFSILVLPCAIPKLFLVMRRTRTHYSNSNIESLIPL